MSRLFTIFLLLVCQTALAEIEDWIPSARHAELVSQGRDCAIYRSLSTKARLTVEQSQDAELHFSELLKVRRADLVQCAQNRSVDMDGSEEADEFAAEVCPDLFALWVKTGYRLRAVQQDREGAQHSVEMLDANLERYCARPSESAPGSIRIR